MFGLKRSVKTAVASALVCAAFLGASPARALEPAQGDVILTVTGAIANTNLGDAAAFDIEMLEELPSVTFETTTIWTEGVQTFTGVELAELAAAVGMTGQILRASAINDYAVDIPLGDAVAGGPIIAYMRNGEAMSLRDKGPLWVVYPFDSSPDYQTEVVYSRSIWQLDRIEVLP